MIVVEIAGERCGLEGPAELERAIEVRYGGFVVQAAPTVRLALSLGDGFRGDYTRPVALDLRIEGTRLRCEHALFDLASNAGTLEGLTDLGALDALLRAIVATRAPLRRTLLLHGLVAPSEDGALVLVGHSGAGKSTAARTLGAASDELVSIDVDAGLARSTPYWGGRPFAAPLQALGVLSRGDARVASLRGAAAIRALAPHVVRYVRHEPTDRVLFVLLAELGARGVWSIEAPVGDAFPAFVQHAAAEMQRARA